MKANTVKSQSKPTGKRIDLGAASNFGKDLGINSPTHRNTHSEDLFSVENNNTTSSNNVIDELDDFNPRAEENTEFGDFTTAFGTSTNTNKKEELDEFADFTSAFTATTAPAVAPVTATNTSTGPSADLLFGDIPAPSITPSTKQDVNQPDLFSALGGLTSSAPINTGTADLLSDFKGISLGGPQINGEF